MSFVKDNKAFDKWLAAHCTVVKPDIKYKHHRMEKSAFVFLRATYFRWARKIGDWCPELMDAPRVRAVGEESNQTPRKASLDCRLISPVSGFRHMNGEPK